MKVKQDLINLQGWEGFAFMPDGCRLVDELGNTIHSICDVLEEWRAARMAAVEEGATPDRFMRLGEAESALMKEIER